MVEGSVELVGKLLGWVKTLPRARFKEYYFSLVPSIKFESAEYYMMVGKELGIRDLTWIAKALTDSGRPFLQKWIALQMLDWAQPSYSWDDLEALAAIKKALGSLSFTEAPKVEMSLADKINAFGQTFFQCRCGRKFADACPCGRDTRGFKPADVTPKKAIGKAEAWHKALSECLEGTEDVSGLNVGLCGDGPASLPEVLKDLEGEIIAVNCDHAVNLSPACLVSAAKDYFMIRSLASDCVYYYPYSSMLSMMSRGSQCFAIGGIDAHAIIEVHHMVEPTVNVKGAGPATTTFFGVNVNVPLDLFSS